MNYIFRTPVYDEYIKKKLILPLFDKIFKNQYKLL